MKREKYLEMRNNNTPFYIYEWYLEHRNKEKVLLSIEDFFNFFQFWPESQNVYNIMVSYWDAHFNILHVPTRDKIIYI